MTIQVGSTIRAPRGVAKLKGRAIVALIQEEDGTACIFWEDLAPRPIVNGAFLVTPMVPKSNEEREDTVEASQLSKLLDFEQDVGDESKLDVAQWKERGDELLRLGDASAAIPYYEAGLSTSSVLQVGSTGLIPLNKDDFQVVEVDYLEDDGNVDVTIDGNERTIRKSEIKLCLLVGQESIQVRILLNLSRCLMQVADLEDSQISAYYRRSAATACSMALAILASLDTQETESLHATALLLRSKAYTSRSKWKAAMTDAQTLIRDHPERKEGRAWTTQLEAQTARQQKTNQKLAKSMCVWVQNATASTTGEESDDRKEPPVSQEQQNGRNSTTTDADAAETTKQSPLTLFWYLLFPLLLALCINRILLSQDSNPD